MMGGVFNRRAMLKVTATALGFGATAGRAQDGAGLTSLGTKKTLPRVRVLGTGGTIAGRGPTSTAIAEYQRGAVSGDELLARVPEIRDHAEVSAEQLTNIYGSDITLKDWLQLGKRINQLFREDPKLSGIVVTQGTNAIEETAYFLNLTVKDTRPVVVVGALRPGSAISADGPKNLLDAVRTASDPAAQGKGVMIILNEEINSAREGGKSNTYRLGAFRGGELGFLGYVDHDHVTFYRTSTRRHTANSEFDISRLTDFPRVDILYAYLDANPATIPALVESGTQGIVFAGAGAGGLSKAQRNAIEKFTALPAQSRPIIVRASRTGNGRIVEGGAEYRDLGTITADNLSPQKARILLMLALTKTRDPAEIKRMFAEY